MLCWARGSTPASPLVAQIGVGAEYVRVCDVHQSQFGDETFDPKLNELHRELPNSAGNYIVVTDTTVFPLASDI